MTTMESVLFELLRSKDALLGAKRATCWKHGDPVDDVDGMVIFFIEGSLEVKLPTIWTHEKAEVGRERVRRKKMQAREKVEKSRNTVFFPMFWSPGESNSRLAKARVRSHLAR